MEEINKFINLLLKNERLSQIVPWQTYAEINSNLSKYLDKKMGKYNCINFYTLITHDIVNYRNNKKIKLIQLYKLIDKYIETYNEYKTYFIKIIKLYNNIRFTIYVNYIKCNIQIFNYNDIDSLLFLHKHNIYNRFIIFELFNSNIFLFKLFIELNSNNQKILYKVINKYINNINNYERLEYYIKHINNLEFKNKIIKKLNKSKSKNG